MPESWMTALNAFFYRVDLSTYERADDFEGFFEITVEGDRNSTILFENRYQALAPATTAAFFEVVYWKLYSQGNVRDRSTSRIVDYVQERGIAPMQMWEAVQQFVADQTGENLQTIRQLLGLATDVLAVPLTLTALASPETLPMVDRQVARWVSCNHVQHSANRIIALNPFIMNHNVLRQNDFPNYLNWVTWCREVAQVLMPLTKQEWRPRDVEMAVFTAQRRGMALNVLP